MNQPKISIITVTYNAEKFIERAILSVVSQTYHNIEYIIIDGQSRDSTMQIVQKYASKITKIISEPDSGIYDAMNKGIDYASGDILYFLNADDRLYTHDVVKDVLAQFNGDATVDLIFGRLEFENVPQEHQIIVDELQSSIYKNRRAILTHIPPQQAVFARRKMFDQAGKFDTGYQIAADTEWFARCLNANAQVRFIDKRIAYFNTQGLSYIRNKAAIQERIRAIWSNSSFMDFWLYFVPVRSFLALKFFCVNTLQLIKKQLGYEN